jgi:hypothetical protein
VPHAPQLRVGLEFLFLSGFESLSPNVVIPLAPIFEGTGELRSLRLAARRLRPVCFTGMPFESRVPLPRATKRDESDSPPSAYTLREASTGVVTNTAPALLQFLKTKTTQEQ